MLAAGAAQALLVELLDAVEEDQKRLSLDELRAEIATGLACRAAIKINIEPIKLCCHPQSRTKFHEANQVDFLRVSSRGFV